MLLTECSPNVCAAGQRCCNQAFEKRLYPPLEPSRTSSRGWGLKVLADLKKGKNAQKNIFIHIKPHTSNRFFNYFRRLCHRVCGRSYRRSRIPTAHGKKGRNER